MINYRPKGYTTMTEASKEEDEPKDFNNDNGGVGGGQKTRPRGCRQRRRQKCIDDGPDGLVTKTECQFYLPSRRLQQHHLVSVLSLSKFDIFFIRFIFIPFAARKIISTAKCEKYFYTKFTLTLRMYPLHTYL